MQEDHYIPANYTDAGKILGAFPIRNTVEACVCVIPLILLVFPIPVFSIMTRFVVVLILAVPVGGFALIGVHDESLLQFFQTWSRWRRHRGILFYRG